MAIKVTKTDVWAATIEDRAGGAAEKLQALSDAGVSLEMALARRTPENPGKGTLFVTPIKGTKTMRAARAAQFAKPENIHSLRIEGDDKPGLGAMIARSLGEAGISFRGISAVAIGRKFLGFIALDSAEDATRALGVLKKIKEKPRKAARRR
jgi:hypothetical protein